MEVFVPIMRIQQDSSLIPYVCSGIRKANNKLLGVKRH